MDKQTYKDMIGEQYNEIAELKSIISSVELLVKNTPNNMELGKQIRAYFQTDDSEETYIFESPDGKTVFRRPMNNYDPKNKMEIVNGKPTGRTFDMYSNGKWNNE